MIMKEGERMKFANLHDDIGNDIFDNREVQPNRLDEFHYPRFKSGNMKFSAIVCCFHGDLRWQDMEAHILYCEQAVNNSKHFSFGTDKEIQVFLAVEGMCGIRKNASECIHWLYNHHVRLGSLCWNDDNALACGAKSGNKPLTEMGIEVIKTMNAVNMAIDTSHCCEWNYYDIARISTKPIMASHSNVKALYNHYRNLSEPQLQVIVSKDGIVGGIPVRWFVKKKDDNATLEDFLDVLMYLKEKIGYQRVALGFDFMDYMEGMEDSNVVNMKDISQIDRIASGLERRGCNEQEIEAICFSNAYNYMQPYLSA